MELDPPSIKDKQDLRAAAFSLFSQLDDVVLTAQANGVSADVVIAAITQLNGQYSPNKLRAPASVAGAQDALSARFSKVSDTLTSIQEKLAQRTAGNKTNEKL